MNNTNNEGLRKRFGPFFAMGLKFDVPNERYDLLLQLFSDIQNFMSRSPEYQVVIEKVRETDEGTVWIGWTLKTRGRRREKGHDEWLVYRLREIFAQYEWDSRYEKVALHKECSNA